MQYYFAPMEGITLFPLRNAHRQCFPGIDKYFSPFLVANQTLHFHQNEIRDILPRNNKDIVLIPQILTNRADQMVWAMEKLSSYGYTEINLNLGCPMPQVAKRGRGAGFLQDPQELDRFFGEVFSGIAGKGLALSVKTRIGLCDESLADELTEVFNRHPIHELIIHPRLMSDRYQGSPRLGVFSEMLKKSVHPVCYNGDIRSPEDLAAISRRFPGVSRVMIGRGLLSAPALVWKIRKAGGFSAGAAAPDPQQTDPGMPCTGPAAYHSLIYRAYREMLPDGRQAVAKMKDVWSFWQKGFPGREKELKKIRKSVWPEQYEEAVAALLSGG